MKGKLEIRRPMAVLVLILVAIGGGVVSSMIVGPGRTAPVFVATAHAASVDPGQMLSFNNVVNAASPAVVNISSTKVIKASQQRGQMPEGLFNDPMFRRFFGEEGGRMPVPRDRRESSLGSGVIVSPDGYILTNNHVVEGATTVKVAMSDRREFTAKVIGTDPQSDVAVIKIEGSKLPVLALSSAKVQVGDLCLAIGNPFGIGQSVTMGIVGATGRNLRGAIEAYEDFIQTDAAINPGNSGGALINTKGELIGINTAIMSRTGGNNGIGFAIPVTMARNIMDQLMRTGKVTRGFIGAVPQDVDAGLAKAFKLPNTNGAVLAEVTKGSPAELGGLKAGDVVTQINGQPVQDASALRLQIAAMPPESNVKFSVVREGKPTEVNVKLGARPTDLDGRGDRDDDGTPAKPGRHSGLEGVSVDDMTPQIARQLGLERGATGVVVTDVEQSSTASEAGLERGDVIVQVNRQPVKSATDFERMVSSSRGSQTLLLVNRRGANRFIAIESK